MARTNARVTKRRRTPGRLSHEQREELLDWIVRNYPDAESPYALTTSIMQESTRFKAGGLSRRRAYELLAMARQRLAEDVKQRVDFDLVGEVVSRLVRAWSLAVASGDPRAIVGAGKLWLGLLATRVASDMATPPVRRTIWQQIEVDRDGKIVGGGVSDGAIGGERQDEAAERQ